MPYPHQPRRAPATFSAQSMYVHSVGETEHINEKFSKRVVVLTDRADKYPTFVPVEFQRDKCPLLDGIRIGDLVDVHGELKGREWNGRFFMNAVGTSINVLSSPNMVASPAAAPAQQTLPDHLKPEAAQTAMTEQLPF